MRQFVALLAAVKKIVVLLLASLLGATALAQPADRKKVWGDNGRFEEV